MKNPERSLISPYLLVSSVLRKYRNEDFDALLELFRRNTPSAFAPEEEAEFRTYLLTELEDYFVWEENGKVLAGGGINYHPEEKEIRLSWDMVDPSIQGKGIGKALFQYRFRHILSKHQYVKLVVRTSQMAHEFYGKRGFQLVYTEKDYWAPGYDLYFMTLNLR